MTATAEEIVRAEVFPRLVLRHGNNFVYDMSRRGWSLIEDTPLPEGDLDFRLCVFVQGEQRFEMQQVETSGSILLEQAREVGGLTGQIAAERLLQRRDQIPEEWRGFFLLFPGTTWKNNDDDLVVPCLEFEAAQWELVFGAINERWSPATRVVRFVK